MSDDDFWDDLLGHIQQQKLVPVVGPDLAVVKVDNAEQTLTTLIGQRLADRFDLPVSPGMTMAEAVEMFLGERGRDRDEADRLYRVIWDMIRKLNMAPGEPLRNLAAITDLRLFVNTTPDRLLARALNEVRFHGGPVTRELTFSPWQSTSEHLRNKREGAPTDTVLLNLFGTAVSTPEYAIHEEDKLEWLHALLSDPASIPGWLDYPLRHQPMLFVGCEIPDWLGRFLLRFSSSTRLSLERKPFFVVGPYPPSLSKFFATYCRRLLVQHLEKEPAAFVAELRERWAETSAPVDPVPAGPDEPQYPPSTDRSQPTIFISYMREDVDAARRLRNAIIECVGDVVWMDERRLRPGDSWEPEILYAIRRTVRLFVPIISANTEREQEGYVFREWRAAEDRASGIMGRRFIVPVVVDERYEGDPSRFQQLPEGFRDLQFGRAPAGDPDANLLGTLIAEIRAMRRIDAA